MATETCAFPVTMAALNLSGTGAADPAAIQNLPSRRTSFRHRRNCLLLSHTVDLRLETLETLAADGDEYTAAELWNTYGIDRRVALT